MPANANTNPTRKAYVAALATVGAQVRYPFPVVGVLPGTITRKTESSIWATFTRPVGSANGGNQVTFRYTQRLNGEYYKAGTGTFNAPTLVILPGT